ncbi:MAG: serine/threonine protein kinase [Proteobacteria bacterium]|nr:serine/threonine protein kinase [Pseudomonadota bacterium]
MTTSHLHPDARIGTKLAGKYELLELIGQGGAGYVYSAMQHPLERAVAVKMLRDDLGERGKKEISDRFLREAAVTGRLSHPNLVTVYDFGTTLAGERFVVMELLRGRTLKSAMRGKLLEPREAVRIAIGILKGLRHAHAHDLVHRDVKPSNIFLVRDDDGVEQPKILDFGLVKGGDSEMTRSGTYMGTPTYVSPEQAKGKLDVDHRADQYSLGVLLYRALTGVVPFRAEGPMATAVAHISEPYPPMSDRAPSVQVDPALEAIVRRAMAKAPDDRFSSSSEMARALHEWAGQSMSISSIAISGYGHEVGAAATVVEEEPPKRARALVGGGLLAVGATSVLALLSAVLCVGLTSSSTSEPTASLAEAMDEMGSRPAIERPRAPLTDELDLVGDFAAPEPPPAPDPAPSVASDSAPKVAKVEEPAPAVVVKPTPAPAPAPAPTPVAVAKPAPAPSPAPAVAPSPAPAPAPTVAKAVSVDGVSFDAPHAARAVEWLNTADEVTLRAAGVYGRGVGIVLGQRPFASIEAFGTTPYVGEKTVQAVADATR